MTPATLERESATFQRRKSELIEKYGGLAWVVVIDDECEGPFHSFQAAAKHALEKHADRKFLIRQTDEPPIQIPLVIVHE